MEVNGKGGTVRVGGRSAATLGTWTLEGAPTDWVLHAELLAHNPIWLGGAGPFELRLQLVAGQWRWPSVQAQIVNGSLRATGQERWMLIGTG